MTGEHWSNDNTKMWSMVSVAVGALVGGALGLLYGESIVHKACAQSDASNLCGLIPSSFVLGYVLIGAVIGALAATVAVFLSMSRKA